MNICLVSQEYPPETARGGIGTQTWNKARALVALGHTVHVVSSGGRRDRTPRVTLIDGAVVHRIPPPDHDASVHELAAYWLGYSWAILRYLDGLRATVSFDLVNFPEYGAEGFAFQLNRTRFNWIPVVVQLHGPLAMFADRIGWPEKDSALSTAGTFMEGWSIREADALMASSINIADFTARHYGVPRDRIGVVHCGIDVDMFRPPGNGVKRSSRPSVLFIGNIAANKGIITVVEAVLRLRTKYPDIELRVAGQADDELMLRLQRRVNDEGASENVRFLGFVPDRAQLPRLYQHAQVFCSPAQHEVGVANVYVEAMACGCPVVASTTGGAPEAVLDGRTGLLVPPRDVIATAEAIDRLLTDERLRQRMADDGRQWVEEYFTLHKYIARVVRAYGLAIDRGKRKLAALDDEAEGKLPGGATQERQT